MARLPSHQYVMQQSGGEVRLFEDGSERLLIGFDPAREDAALTAAQLLELNEYLGEEDKCFAQFWAGYFHGCAEGGTRTRIDLGPGFALALDGDDAVLSWDGSPAARWPAADGNRVAQAQKVIHEMPLLDELRPAAHFWAGYFWAAHGDGVRA